MTEVEKEEDSTQTRIFLDGQISGTWNFLKMENYSEFEFIVDSSCLVKYNIIKASKLFPPGSLRPWLKQN